MNDQSTTPARRLEPGVRRRYRVYFEQVNRTYIEITAGSRDEAVEKAARRWRRDWATPSVDTVEADDA